MNNGTLALLIPLVAIGGGTLIKLATIMYKGRPPIDSELHARLDALEQELGGLRQELVDAQERLDFTERMLARGEERRPSEPA